MKIVPFLLDYIEYIIGINFGTKNTTVNIERYL
jgi:hypothetical protein